MKNKYFLFIFIFGITLSISYSQTELIYGEFIPKEKKMNPKLYDVADDESIFVFSSSKKSQLISRYNKDLTLMNEKKFSDLLLGKVKKVMIKNGTVSLISYDYDKKNKKIIYYRHYGEIDDLELQTEEILVIDDETAKSYFGVSIGFFFIDNGFNQIEGFGLGQVFTSSNNNFLSIIIDIKDKNKQKSKVFTFNSDFKLITKVDYNKDIKDKLVDIQDIFIDDNDGSIYLIIKEFHNKSNKEKYNKKVNYHFEITKLSKNESNTIRLATKKKYIENLEFYENEKGLYLIGYFSNLSEYKQQGLYISLIDKLRFKQGINKLIIFNDDYIENASQRNSSLSTSKEFVKNYKVQKFYYLNESFYVFAETSYISSPSSSGLTHITHGNISIHKLNDELDILDYEIINRYTATKCSYHQIKNKFILYFLGFKKIKRKKEVYTSISGRSKLFQIEINEELLKNEKEYKELIFSWYRFVNVNNEYSIFFSRNKKEKRLIKLISN